MELKWLEDLVSVAEKGHFARAALDRGVTQSALSRRIKSLELWAGAELLDRSQHPISLTPAGEEFMLSAREIIKRSYKGRADVVDYARIADTGVTLACLHTLALFFIPTLVRDLRKAAGAFETSVIADARTVEEYLEGLYNGSSDFFVCFDHAVVSFDIDEKEFPRLDIGTDRILPYRIADDANADFFSQPHTQIPYLEFSGTSYLSRVVEHIIQKAPFKGQLSPVFRASLGESLCTAALQGLGVAWLPESMVINNPRAERLECLGEEWSTTLKIAIFRSATNSRTIVDKIWSELEKSMAQPA